METIKTEIAVLGAGPGGYTAAFYASDKGKKVVLIEQDPKLGGVCLNRGCIPSKTLLGASHCIREAEDFGTRGLVFGAPRIEIDKLRAWKDSVVDKLASGVASLAQRRNVMVLTGRGTFQSSNTMKVETADGPKLVQFEKAVIATGSRPAMPAMFNIGHPGVMTSTEALALGSIPEDLLVIGGGYIGMELGTVYASLGSKVAVVEALGSMLAGADPDLVRPVARAAEKLFKAVRVGTHVKKIEPAGEKIKAVFSSESGETEELYDKVLVAVGRVPNSKDLGLENTKVTTDEKGFIQVNSVRQTSDPAIGAIGDVVGGMMLAHKASREARSAVDFLLGEVNTSDDAVIPAVVFTQPEIAWCGLTETEARAKNIPFKVARFPWGASGRALTLDRPEGLTKLIADPGTERILGIGISGAGAGELIAEGVLAIEMGATVRNLASAVHPHPTLSETLMECAEVFYGESTHTAPPRRNPASA